MDDWRELKERCSNFIGDSAYSLRSFLVTPYDIAIHGMLEDNFNFSTHHQELPLHVLLMRLIFDGVFYGGACSFGWI
jgi:hypothetical protein